MRKIVIILSAALVLTGLTLYYAPMAGLPIGDYPIVELIHIWGGWFFIVTFLLYAIDHISGHRHWLRRAAPITLSGITQSLSALVLIFSGVVLFLYGTEVWETMRAWHHWWTYPFALALTAHFLSPKR